MVDNHIEIGDKVLIGGLLGNDFTKINNKIGFVEKIMFSSSEYYVTYIVDIKIEDFIIPINLAYIYKLDDLDTFNYAQLSEDYMPIDYYLNKFNVIGIPTLLFDDNGKSYLLCKTRENNMQPLLLTSLN